MKELSLRRGLFLDSVGCVKTQRLSTLNFSDQWEITLLVTRSKLKRFFGVKDKTLVYRGNRTVWYSYPDAISADSDVVIRDYLIRCWKVAGWMEK